MNVLSDALGVSYDQALKSLTISHPDQETFRDPLVRIREETYSKMSFDELAAFLGARVLLLMPAMRSHFAKEIDQMRNA